MTPYALTPEQIDAMPAGPEMDLLVESKVLGKTGPARRPYSTSNEAASEMLGQATSDRTWCARTYHDLSSQVVANVGDHTAEGEILALAVCRAALKAALAEE